MNDERAACEQFEIAVLRRAHGDLDADAAAALDQHLRTCERCQRFAAAAAATEDRLRERAAAAFLGEPPDTARAMLRRRFADRRRRVLRTAVVLVLVVALQAWAGGLRAALAVGSMAVVIVVVGLSLTVFLPNRRLVAASTTLPTGDFLAFLREDLDRELESQRRGRPFVYVMMLLGLLLFARTAVQFVDDVWLAPQPLDAKTYLVPLVILVALVASLRNSLGRSAALLERQREDLS